MRIFLAGATGVIGAHLLPLMLAQGHEVAAMTRTPEKMGVLEASGALAVLCDVYDKDRLVRVVGDYGPEIIVHQLTDLPDLMQKIREFAAANDRMRSEGTQNLLAAAGGRARVIAQSIAWPGGPAVVAHEEAVTAAGGVVLRYGQFYGPGTYYENTPPRSPRIHVAVAAERTMPFLAAPSGVFSVIEGEVQSGVEATTVF